MTIAYKSLYLIGMTTNESLITALKAIESQHLMYRSIDSEHNAHIAKCICNLAQAYRTIARIRQSLADVKDDDRQARIHRMKKLDDEITSETRPRLIRGLRALTAKQKHAERNRIMNELQAKRDASTVGTIQRKTASVPECDTAIDCTVVNVINYAIENATLAPYNENNQIDY